MPTSTSKFKFASADFSFPLLHHDKVFKLIAMLGMDGVDIGLFQDRSHLQPSHVTKDISGTARNLEKRVTDCGLEIADVFLQAATDFQSHAINNPDKAVRQEARDLFLRTLEFTCRCNAKHMSGLPGVLWDDEPPDDSLRRCSEELAWRCERASDAGVIFSIEAHLGSIVTTPEQTLKLVEMTPNLTLTLDYTHFTYQGIPDERVEPLIAQASHFHARCGCKDRLQAPAKENTIDYDRILKSMKATAYGGYIGIEYVWIDWERCNEVDNLSETIMLYERLREATK